MRILLAILICSSWVLALTDQELIAIRDGFDQRSSDMLDAQVANPYPGDDTAWGQLDFALAAFLKDTRLDDANQAVIRAIEIIRNEEENGWGDFHWKGNHFTRIYECFAADSTYYPGRLTSDTEDAICQIMFDWAKAHTQMFDWEIANSKTWYVWGSENHDAQKDATSWGAAKILSRRDDYKNLLYDDGNTPTVHFAAANEYMKAYFVERGRKGQFVEISSGYGPYTRMGWYNMYDFSEDPELKRLAMLNLDLNWALWAQEQIDAVRGGGKTRMYQDGAVKGSDSNDSEAWFHFGIGPALSQHPKVQMAATTTYRVPLVVIDLAMDSQGKGEYESYVRKMGLNILPKPEDADLHTYVLDPDYGGLVKYTWCEPEYIMGCLLMDNIHWENWSAISSQNRWAGVIFKGHVDARIYPQCEAANPDYGKTTNDLWNIQSKGTMISQKTSGSKYADNAGPRVFFSSMSTKLYRYEDSGWVFADVQDCYAAVKPAYGGYYWQTDNWMKLNEEFSPVVIEVGLKSNYDSLTSFKNDVKDNLFDYDSEAGIFTYEAIDNRGTLTFYTKTLERPRINGQTYDLKCEDVFKSPYVNSVWKSGIVEIAKDNRSVTLNFNKFSAQPLKTDMNNDGTVDIYDFVIFSSYWLD